MLQLKLLATLRDCRELGAASLNLLEALNRADLEHCPVYVWAAEVGATVYEKWDFVEIDLGDLHINTGHKDDEEWMEVAREYAFTWRWMERKRRSER